MEQQATITMCYQRLVKIIKKTTIKVSPILWKTLKILWKFQTYVLKIDQCNRMEFSEFSVDVYKFSATMQRLVTILYCFIAFCLLHSDNAILLNCFACIDRFKGSNGLQLIVLGMELHNFVTTFLSTLVEIFCYQLVFVLCERKYIVQIVSLCSL